MLPTMQELLAFGAGSDLAGVLCSAVKCRTCVCWGRCSRACACVYHACITSLLRVLTRLSLSFISCFILSVCAAIAAHSCCFVTAVVGQRAAAREPQQRLI